jgi:hypothetical protein
MKSLKQKMETELDSMLYLGHDFNKIETEFLRLTKAWLIAKQKEVTETEENPLRKMCRVALLIELQEELL